MEIISGILIGVIGVISALVTTNLTNKKSSDENYNAIMQKEKNILIENSKATMNEYNDALDETILLFKATNSNYRTSSEERLENIEKLKSIRNKVNLEFPSFEIDQKNFFLHNNHAFRGAGVREGKDDKKLYLRRKVSKSEQKDNEKDTIEEAIFTMMILLENVMSYNKSDVIRMDKDISNDNSKENSEGNSNKDSEDNFIIVNDSLIDSYKHILFKLQQSLFYINRLTIEKRKGRDFIKLVVPEISDTIEDVEDQISKIYFNGILNPNTDKKDDKYKEKEFTDISQVKKTNEQELEDFEDLFPTDEESTELPVAELVITTLDRLKKADLEIIKKWSSSDASNRYLLNTTPKHKNGQDFVNYHIYPSDNIFIEAHHSKGYIKRLLEKYILAVLKENGQLNEKNDEKIEEDNTKKKTKRNFSDKELDFIERHTLNKNDSIRNLLISSLESLEKEYEIRPMDLTDNKTLVSKTNKNPDGKKLPKANKYVTKKGIEYYFNTHMNAPAAIKSLIKYEEFLREHESSLVK
ncbi:hypothetical protein [Salinicoccus kekensis]|uniref:Uncharacterized protein n=1 Tax=Salinicoccus kekensis TaxID=714307 RepID=A0A285UG33_9STAP|nr:hypothetical protein [Salinicoccus kekensis]SOC40752.1 hypothetical protein SAMN05878391_1099 [Salinicoccus kekensis]